MRIMSITGSNTMADVLRAFPGAQRALFRKYHIGGCSSCAFKLEETLEQVCQRNQILNVGEVLEHLQKSHDEDSKILISPAELKELRRTNPGCILLDIRSKTEFDAANIEGAILLNHPVLQQILGGWNRQSPIVIIDHQGKNSLDAAAYFMGQGFTQVRCLRGGIDAWAQEVDPNVRRYQIA